MLGWMAGSLFLQYSLVKHTPGSRRGTNVYKIAATFMSLAGHASNLFVKNYYHEFVVSQGEYLTRPLRSPPAVVREVQKSRNMPREGVVRQYSEREVPDHTDGPPVKRVDHRGEGHYYGWLGDCDKCGREVASFLHSLRVGSSGNPTTNVTSTSRNITPTSVGATPPCLLWKDMLVLYWETTSDNSGFVTGMKESRIQVEVMKDDNIADVATTRSDVVWVADGPRV
ncbi:uncharacterized protein LOC112574902 [Pomacea canaliculata]|uniref:uncharacterized protein LOC112574902 n=1 Tax=Pomacea canaliculata TaxID=400727 RepID=UPI000D7344AD|nr:uncharacterized protein LOC112574902 [Pomacea canaliculata]